MTNQPKISEAAMDELVSKIVIDLDNEHAFVAYSNRSGLYFTKRRTSNAVADIAGLRAMVQRMVQQEHRGRYAAAEAVASQTKRVIAEYHMA